MSYYGEVELVVEVVAVEHLSKYYRNFCVFNDACFSVYTGEVFGILGETGSGKTTLIRLLLGYLNPSQGSIRIFGLSPREDSTILNKDIGYIPSQITWYRYTTGYHMLSYLSKLRDHALYEVEELLSLFPVPLHEKMQRYSPAMQQKFGIIQAFMHDPSLIFMDEPTHQLDEASRKTFFSFLSEKKKNGATILITSQQLDDLAGISDRIGWLQGGVFHTFDNIEALKATEKLLLSREHGKNQGGSPQEEKSCAD